jgi:hypothetical protein
MRKSLGAVVVAAVLLMASTARAGPILLTQVALNDPLQQQTNNPCLLGGNDCNSRTTAEIPDFTPTPTGNIGENISWDLTSPEYSVAGIRLLFGDEFRVGLDFSQAQGQPDQVLGLFAMTINGSVQDLFVGPAAVPPTPAGNAGNGFADYILTGFNLTGFALTDRVQFHAIMPVSNDGPDQAFLIRGINVPPPPPPPPAPIPEPASMVLLGSGLFGLAMKLRRRK